LTMAAISSLCASTATIRDESRPLMRSTMFPAASVAGSPWPRRISSRWSFTASSTPLGECSETSSDRVWKRLSRLTAGKPTTPYGDSAPADSREGRRYSPAAMTTPPTAVELALMAGTPPAGDALVTLDNWQLPPWNRWGFQHVRELIPTARIRPAADPWQFR